MPELHGQKALKDLEREAICDDVLVKFGVTWVAPLNPPKRVSPVRFVEPCVCIIVGNEMKSSILVWWHMKRCG